MRILLTIHHTLTGDAGAPGVVLRLRDEFLTLGHEARILSFDDLPASLRRENIRMAAFPWFCARALRKAAPALDVIDASSGDAWLYARLPRGAQRPLLVSHSHGLEHVRHDQRLEEARRGDLRLSWRYGLYHGGLRLWECAQSFRRADLALFLNAPDRQYAIERLGVRAGRARVVGNGLPRNLIGLPVGDWNDNSPITIAQIGSYIPRKGIAVGAEALTRVLSRHRDVRVLFLGTGCPQERVHADFPANVRDRITVVPHFPHDSLRQLLEPCQIKMLPSFAEGFPLAPLEAMACGLAPVVSAIPGPLEYVKADRNGLVVPPGDAIALENAVSRLIEDAALLARLRAAAYRTAQAYAWRQVALTRLALYAEFSSGRLPRHVG